MKKLQFMAWPKLCSLFLFGAAALFTVSCADDELSGDTFVGTYSGSQLSKPDEGSITIKTSADRTTQTVSWKTVDGALSYVINVRAGSNKDSYDEVVAKDVLVRGNSYTFARTSKKYYRVSLTTAYNPAEGNTASDPNDPAVKEWDTFSTDITLPVGTDLASYFKENDPKTLSEGMPLIIGLEAGGEYTVSDAIDFSGVNATISGDSENMPVITFANQAESMGTIVTDYTFGFENVEIQWEESESAGTALVQLSKTPGYEATNNYYRIDRISFTNVKITDLKGCLVFDNSVQYCIVELTIDNCLMKLATVTSAINNGSLISIFGGGIKDFSISNSTVYQTGEGNSQYFLRYNNSARIDRFGFNESGYEPNKTTITYHNNTFYKVASGNWSNYTGIQNGTIYDISKNIWFECGDGAIARRILGNGSLSSSSSATWTFNTYSADQGTYDTGTYFTTDPGFANPAEGDFTISGSDQLSNQTGDPRWLK
ncbi:MAG: DUF4957 domain-containing protein [Prevotella sp.]|nr:DUF4957 domain-containing protein [Prevotella sp.]